MSGDDSHTEDVLAEPWPHSREGRRSHAPRRSNDDAIDLAVMVVIRDRFCMYAPCVDALYANTALPFRLILVAGGADEPTRRCLRDMQDRRKDVTTVFCDPLLSQAEARNIGLREVRERYFAIVENDSIVHANWLPPLLECMAEEGAAVVTPLIAFAGGVHAAGCTIEIGGSGGERWLTHTVCSSDIRRRRIDYPETHCILLDRSLLPGDLFDEAEPMDVDFGLTLRERGLKVFLEPRSVVTYIPPPPLRAGDLGSFSKRWDPEAWKARNDAFMNKWCVRYDASVKLAAYRRQQAKVQLARTYPNRVTIALTNAALSVMSVVRRVLRWMDAGGSSAALRDRR
jgi:hypothetical protein